MSRVTMTAVLMLLVALCATPASADGGSYTVQHGDTVWGVATAHACDQGSILKANNLRANQLIYAGQKLRLPSNCTSVMQVLTDEELDQVAKGGYVVGPVVRVNNQTFKLKQTALPFATGVRLGDKFFDPVDEKLPKLRVRVPRLQRAVLHPLGLLWDGKILRRQIPVDYAGVGMDTFSFPSFKYEVLSPNPGLLPEDKRFEHTSYASSYDARRQLAVVARVVPQLDTNGELVVDVMDLVFTKLQPIDPLSYGNKIPYPLRWWEEGEKPKVDGLLPGDLLKVVKVNAEYFKVPPLEKVGSPWTFVDVASYHVLLERADGKTVSVGWKSNYYLEVRCDYVFGCSSLTRAFTPEDVGKSFYVDRWVHYPQNNFLGLKESLTQPVGPFHRYDIQEEISRGLITPLSGIVQESYRTPEVVVRLDTGEILKLEDYAYLIPVGTRVVAYKWVKPPLSSEVFMIVDLIRIKLKLLLLRS